MKDSKKKRREIEKESVGTGKEREGGTEERENGGKR